eukprot:gene31668-42228_t
MLLAGCSLIPTYERPAAPVPTTFPGDPAQPAGQAAPEFAELLQQGVAVSQDPLGMVENAESLGRETVEAVPALDDQHAQFLLQRPDG